MLRLLCLILLLPVALRAAEAPYEPTGETEPFVTAEVSATLMLPRGRAPAPVVVILHDALGPDPRSALYEDQLLGAGLAVLNVIALAEPEALAALPAALAAHPRLRADRSGLLGFGEGGRIAAGAHGGFAARALLYPGCAALPALAEPGPVLLLHGTADPANPPALCGARATGWQRQGREVRHVTYAGATYGWDHPPFGPETRFLLPRPDASGHVVAEPWPQLAMLSASEVAGFLAMALR